MWARLDDQFFVNRKVMKVSKDAKLLYLAGLTHCAGQLTDGAIDADAMRVLARLVDVDTEEAKALVKAGLWKATKDGYQVHDWDKYNPKAASVRRDRAANAKRQAEWREKHRGDRGRFQRHA